MVDLNTLLPADSGWVLLSANAINDAGQIVGEGTLDGEPRAFLLTPPVASDTTPPVVSSVDDDAQQHLAATHQMVDVSVRVSRQRRLRRDAGLRASSASPAANRTTATATATRRRTPKWWAPDHVRVRAERSGPSGARVYTVTVQCTDGSGNAATACGTVTIGESAVAKSQAKAKK